MRTAAQSAQQLPRERPGFWLWPKLLSLDAPLVAVLWQLLFAGSLHVSVAPVATAITALVVWLIYVGDRILDSFQENQGTPQAARHLFYRAQRLSFAAPFAVVLALACWLALARLDRTTFRDGVFLGAMVGGYLAVIHILRAGRILKRDVREWLPKELAVAILFGAGTLLPVYARLPSLGGPLLLTFALFILVLWMNTLLIEYSEWMTLRRGRAGKPHVSTILTGKHYVLAGGIVVALALCAMISGRFNELRPVLLCELGGAMALSGLFLFWKKTPSSLVAPAADAALLTPLLYLMLHRL